MNAQEIRVAVLEAAVEDFTGLWELVWYFRAKMSHRPDQEITRLAQEGARDLLNSGLIALYRGTDFSGEQTMLSSEEALAAIASQQQWDERSGSGPHVRIGATEAGERAYYGSTGQP